MVCMRKLFRSRGLEGGFNMTELSHSDYLDKARAKLRRSIASKQITLLECDPLGFVTDYRGLEHEASLPLRRIGFKFYFEDDKIKHEEWDYTEDFDLYVTSINFLPGKVVIQGFSNCHDAYRGSIESHILYSITVDPSSREASIEEVGYVNGRFEGFALPVSWKQG